MASSSSPNTDWMALHAMEQGSRPPAVTATVDLDQPRPPLAAPPSLPTGGVDCLEGSTVASLPDGILLEILSRLPAKSLFRFKCVSKAWFGLIAECLRKIPRTLQGFFYGDDESYENYGHFVDLLGRSVSPVDPSFSFLTKLPEIENIILLHSCNGLILFWHRRYLNSHDTQTLGYIVCNPATKEWVDVPSSGSWMPAKGEVFDYSEEEVTFTYLIFDPSVSSQFKLVQFCHNSDFKMLQVYTYSSESGVWSEKAIECWSHEALDSCVCNTFVNGALHLTVSRHLEYQSRIVAVNGEGDKCRIMRWAEEARGLIVFLGQSQGHLHCISGHRDQFGSMTELSIWVLEDYDTERWILKDSVSCLQLSGEVSRCFVHSPFAIHPDHNLVFFVHRFHGDLISYDMDTKEVNALSTLEHWSGFITPYIPYFVESSVLSKH